MSSKQVAILAANYNRAETLRRELGIDAYTFSVNAQGHRGTSVEVLLVDDSVTLSREIAESFMPCCKCAYKLERL